MTWKLYGTSVDLPRKDHPPNDQERRALIREATKRTRETLKVLKRSTAQMGDTGQKGWHGKVAGNTKSNFLFGKRNVGGTVNVEKA